MSERPIIFNSESVKAILDGRKTQTRRVIKPQPEYVCFNARTNINIIGSHDNVCVVESSPIHFTQYPETAFVYYKNNKAGILDCPYGQVGDLLWVRETICHFGNMFSGGSNFALIRYKDAVSREIYFKNNPPSELWWYKTELVWKPSIFMPRWASRITLEITNIRVEKLQDISTADVYCEGFTQGIYAKPGNVGWVAHADCEEAFEEAWDSLNAKRGYSWESNPRVWVIEFKVKEKE